MQLDRSLIFTAFTPATSFGEPSAGRVVLSFFDASRQQYAHGVAFTQIAAPDQSEIVEFIHELQQRART